MTTEIVDGAQFFREYQTENQFMVAVLDHFKLRGWLTYHTHISKRSTAGFPDITAVRGGRLVFAELKREKGGVVSPAQRAWLDALTCVQRRVAVNERIVEAYLWRPSDWPEIEQVAA